jgi:hypothetical protein
MSETSPVFTRSLVPDNLPRDFKEFLRLLNAHHVEYLKLEQHKRLETQSEEVGRLLWGFYQSLARKSGN